MIRTLMAAAAVAALSMTVAPQANAWNDIFNSVWGVKGNDTGGIIPWSPENEKNAYEIASNNCKMWNKFPVATSIHRVPGDYIAYACVWDQPAAARHPRRHINAVVEK